jgi:hypothetical protein
MKKKIIDIAVIAFALIAFEIVTIAFTSLYWQHKAIIHHAAFFEANTWGNVSFHWNDDSYAHAPFQDSAPYEKINQDIFQKKLDSLGIK